MHFEVVIAQPVCGFPLVITPLILFYNLGGFPFMLKTLYYQRRHYTS